MAKYKTRRRLSDEFKAETVNLGKQGNRSMTDLAMEMGINAKSIGDWVKRAEESGPAMDEDERAKLRRLCREVNELRMERADLIDSDGLLPQGNSGRFALIDSENAAYPLRLQCRVLRVSKSGYFAWLRRDPSARALEDEKLRRKIAKAP